MAKKKKNIIEKIIDTSKVDEQVRVFPNKVGSYGFDAWGFNMKDMKNSMRFAKFLYEQFYKVETFGLENIPREGRCLIIANHSGQLPFDGMLIGYAMLSNPNGPRAPKAMMERFLPTVPFIGNWLNSMGAVVGDMLNAERMLENEEAIIVFPEGVRGSNKVYKDKYKLQRFGNGFMHLAMKHKTPIIPVSVVGMEETIRSYADIKPLAKLLGMPVAPLVIPWIFPSKVVLHFGTPMYFNNDVYKEHDIKYRVDLVKDEINNLMKSGHTHREQVAVQQKNNKQEKTKL